MNIIRQEGFPDRHFQERRTPVKNSIRFCILTLVLSMLLAFVIFTLFAGGILVLDTSSHIFDLMIAFSCILLSSLLLGSLLAVRRSLRPASCCVSLSAAGGGFLALYAFLTSFSPTFTGIAFSIGIALCFFFLALLVGGIFCLLHGLFSREQDNRRTDADSSPRITAGAIRSGNTRAGTGNPGTGYPGSGYSSGYSGTGVSGTDYSRTGYTGTNCSGPNCSATPSRPSFRRGYEERDIPEDSFFGRRPPL